MLFVTDIHEGNLLLEDADEKQSYLINELKDMGKGKTPLEKKSLLKNAGLFLIGREKILNNFKVKTFLIKNIDKNSTLEPAPEPAPDPTAFDTPKSINQKLVINLC